MVEIPFAASVVSAFLGASFGSLGTYILQMRKESREQRQRVNQLRRGLLGEIKSMGFFDNWPENYSKEQVPAHSLASTEYYQAIASDLGELSEEETEEIAEFYSGLENANEMVEWNHDLTHSVVTDPQLKLDEESRLRRNKKLADTIDSLSEKRKSILTLLEKHLER